MTNNAPYYNAVAIATQGDYHALAKARKRWGDWEAAYHAFSRSTEYETPDPEKELEKLARAGVDLVLLDENAYPPILKEMADPPFGIYIRGKLPDDLRTSILLAIVGTRRATPDGIRIAREFGAALADAGCTVVSGLALGIDAAGHEGALSAGGSAIAVLAGGLSDIYPHTNARLAEKILESGGAVISEYPLGEPPYPRRFLERNRIISGLSRGVLVVEAPAMSGSLATARFALEQNRDVFVVPGPITHPNFKGSHALIRQGAELVTVPEDVLGAYGIAKDISAVARGKNISAQEKLILEALRGISAPAPIDKIIEMTRLEPRIVASLLSFLVIKKMAKETESGYTM